MNEMTLCIDTILADLSAFLVAKYGIAPRDATGLVMLSPVAEQLRDQYSTLQDYNIEQLAALII